jgi:segregation and condensation protein A
VDPTIESDGPRPASSEGRCEVDLPQFEGPLDLLLHLVRRHELDILDIPIAFVCEKYLEYLEVMRALDLETAGEYLVMAATLAYLKSRELVPSPSSEVPGAEPGEEGGPDPRAELIARLLEYQRYRAAAAELERLPVTGRDVFDRGGTVDVEPLDAGLAPITLYRLAEAYHRVLDRARVLKTHEIVIERVSVAGRMKQLTTLLLERARFDFEAIFLEQTWKTEHELRAMLIVTLMSVLEMVRLGIARVHQPEGAHSLLVERAATAEEAERALAGYDEQASFGRPVEDTPGVDEAADDDDAPDDEPFDLGLAGETSEPAPEAALPLVDEPVEAQNRGPDMSAPVPVAAANDPQAANEASAANESAAANDAAAANGPAHDDETAFDAEDADDDDVR